MVNSSTQTQKITISELSLDSNGHSQVNFRLPSPQNRLENSIYLKIENSKPSEGIVSLDRSRKQSADYKFENNVRTKATYCLADTKDKLEYCDRSKLEGVIGVESYHIPSSERLNEDYTMPIKHVYFKES